MSERTHYPEHEKLSAIQPKSQAIGEFLEWLEHEKGYKLCQYWDQKAHREAARDPGATGLAGAYDAIAIALDHPDGYYPIRKTAQQLLAEFFEIDQKAIDQEKERMLDEIRSAQIEKGIVSG